MPRADNRPQGPSRTHLAVALQRLVRATDPKFRRGHAPVIPYVRTAEPWIRRRRIPPSSCHSLRAGDRALASSRTHLSQRVRPPRVQTARLRVRPRVPAPRSARLPPTTRTFHAAGCVSPRAGAFDAVGDSNPVPQRAGCPRPHRNVPTRAECPQPRRPSTGHPWHPEPLVRQLHQRRRPTTTSGPHTGARSGQAGKARRAPGEEAPSPEVQAAARGVRVPDSHRSGWLTPIPTAQRVRRGPPGAPGYGHRPAPAHCAGGP